MARDAGSASRSRRIRSSRSARRSRPSGVRPRTPRPAAASFYEELADVHENLDQPIETIAAMEKVVELEPTKAAHHDRLAWLYRRSDAWIKAAESYERVAELASDDRGRAALRAAGKLYRERGKLDRAAAIYRQIV